MRKSSYLISITCTPPLKEAFLKLQERCGGDPLSKIAREICAAFLVSNGFLENIELANCKSGVPQALFIGTEEERITAKKEIEEKMKKMREKSPPLMERQNIGKRGRGRPKRELIITPVQAVTPQTIDKKKLKELIDEIIKTSPKLNS